MDVNENLIYVQTNLDLFVDIIKVLSLIIFTYLTNFKLTNKKNTINLTNIVLMTITAIIYVLIKKEINYAIGIISLILVISLIYSSKNVGNSILATTISLGINHILSIIAIAIAFFINTIFSVNNDYFLLITITIFHMVMLYRILKIKKLKYGISFLTVKEQNDNLDIIVLNISIIVLFSIMMLAKSNIQLLKNIFPGAIIFAIIMFITIQKSLQLYYKQKLLAQELDKTKEKLEEKIKEVESLEKDNIEISKKNHTIIHKQKSLEHKIDEILMKTEISKEEAGDLRDRLKAIEKEVNKEKTAIELDKTEIPQIDDMLKYMQSECSKNNIDFELQLKGNIHYMTNNLITKEDLETLLADHIKNAIIAINHTENVNRSILVRLGMLDENYGLYIYDSGAEFEIETLENLGKKPSTTHKDEGGTGMGFMNTFDTLRKCKASLTIEEFNKPSKDNYTKVIMIKFDNKNEFKVKSYRENEIKIEVTL